MTFLPVKSVTSNYFSFFTSPMRYQATYNLTKLCLSLVSISADRLNLFVETSRKYKQHCTVKLHMLPTSASPTYLYWAGLLSIPARLLP